MSKYLDAAAELLAEDVQKCRNDRSYLSSERLRHTKLYALLGAIDKGLMPESVAEEIYDQLKSKS